MPNEKQVHHGQDDQKINATKQINPFPNQSPSTMKCQLP
jgi:hypothetical protein